MKLLQLVATIGTASVLSLTGLSAAAASPVQEPAPIAKSSLATPRIIDGSVADFSKPPFAAQHYINGSFNCSASAISATWVILAKHCVANQSASSMSFRLGNANLGQGTSYKVKRVAQLSGGDIALAELSTSYNGPVATLGGTNPSAGTAGDIYGWGRESLNSPPAPKLKTAKVQVTGMNNNSWPGPAIAHKGVDGQALYGDSGGPLIIDGKLVGVCSGPVSDGDIGDPNGNVLYASIPSAAKWVTQTSGVAVK